MYGLLLVKNPLTSRQGYIKLTTSKAQDHNKMSFWTTLSTTQDNDGKGSAKVYPTLNPNQKRFLQDERRYREKLNVLSKDGGSLSEVYVRAVEEDDDAELLDKHDSFYWSSKQLLNLFQYMGVMPIYRNPPVKGLPRTGYSFTSKWFIWAVIIYTLETIIVVNVLKERVSNFISQEEKRFDEGIYNVIFISLLFTHFLLPVAAWRHGSQVAIFKNMWTSYQLKFFKVTGTPINFPNLYAIAWGLCVFSWGLSIAINLSQYFLQPDFKLWYTFAYYHIIAMLNCFWSLW